MKKIFLVLLGCFTFFFVNACNHEIIEHDVYVTVYPMQFIVEEIFKDTPLTVGIVPGVTSHESSVDWYHKEIIAMTKAGLLFYVGANYDRYIDLQIDKIFKNKDVELIKLENFPDYLTFILGVVHDHHHDDDNDDHDHEEPTSSPRGYDPHFWIRPLRVLEAAELIYDQLVEKYPEYVATFATNYALLEFDLQTLSQEFATVISAQTQKILTSTNIYGYLRADYGLNYFSISPGYHEETEQFTSTEHEAIVTEATLHQIRYIIYERNITSPLSNAVFTSLQNLGHQPVKLQYDILQTLTAKERSEGKNYLSIMYSNLDLIILATGYTE